MRVIIRKILGWGIMLNFLQLIIWATMGSNQSVIIPYAAAWFAVLIIVIAVSLFLFAFKLLTE